jgi:hypothetical protein
MTRHWSVRINSLLFYYFLSDSIRFDSNNIINHLVLNYKIKQNIIKRIESWWVRKIWPTSNQFILRVISRQIGLSFNIFLFIKLTELFFYIVWIVTLVYYQLILTVRKKYIFVVSMNVISFHILNYSKYCAHRQIILLRREKSSRSKFWNNLTSYVNGWTFSPLSKVY